MNRDETTNLDGRHKRLFLPIPLSTNQFHGMCHGVSGNLVAYTSMVSEIFSHLQQQGTDLETSCRPVPGVDEHPSKPNVVIA